MQKIISLFQRDYLGDRLVMDKVVPGAEWVVDGEGTATRKWDGTCCRVLNGELWKRYDLPMQKKQRALFKQGLLTAPINASMYIEPPENWKLAEDAPDPNTGHWPGWLPVGNGPEDEWHREAFAAYEHGLADDTYELVGPKIQGNPEGLELHLLIRHAEEILDHAPRDFEGLRTYLAENDIEGIVWHHSDGRMVKLKGHDFGISRGRPGAG